MENKRKTNLYLLILSMIAALGGFLFGYDTAIISGTISFVKVKFAMDIIAEGWFVSSALVGCILGVMIAGELSDRYGRKISLISSSLLFAFSAVGCALSQSQAQLISFRFMGGTGIGIASMVAPLYISEISPREVRGRMVAVYQLAITLGILCAYFVNAWLLKLSTNQNIHPGELGQLIFVNEVWRGMLGSAMIPSSIFFISLLFIPNSPRWFASKGNFEAAERVLSIINGMDEGRKEMDSIKSALEKEEKGSWKILFHGKIKIAIIVGILLAVLSQFTGINAIIYYGPRIMEQAGLKLNDALGGQVIIGLVNMVATIFSIWKIDQYGRKPLMKGGIAGMFISLIMIGILFFTGYTNGFLFIMFVLTFIASFAIGYGPVIWVLLSELYPTKIRGRAMSVATLSLWIGTAIVGQIVPWMLETITPAGTFLSFAICCIPVPFILKFIPETKGLSLEKIEKEWMD